MRRLGIVTVIVIAAGLTWLGSNSVSSAVENSIKLPGARMVVEAMNYGSLQAAIDAVSQEGGVVQLPPGVFEINQPLVINRSDILVRGSGTSTHIKNINTDGEPALVIEPENPGDEDSEPLWRVQLSDFRITGNENSGHGIIARDVNEIFIHGVSVSYHGKDGILLDQCYEDPRISNSLITYNKATGLDLLGCHDIVVDGNQFEENQDALHCFDGFNLCMTGNNLDDHLGNGVVIENTYGSVLAGNMIEECNDFAVILDRDCYGITICANVIAHNGGGVDLRDAHGCAVSANTFTIMKEDAIRITRNSGRITVTGNNFSNSYIGDEEVRRNSDDLAAAGVTLEQSKNISFSGNVFSGLQSKALELTEGSAQSILFGNNLLVDVESDHSLLENSQINDNLENKE